MEKCGIFSIRGSPTRGNKGYIEIYGKMIFLDLYTEKYEAVQRTWLTIRKYLKK